MVKKAPEEGVPDKEVTEIKMLDKKPKKELARKIYVSGIPHHVNED